MSTIRHRVLTLVILTLMVSACASTVTAMPLPTRVSPTQPYAKFKFDVIDEITGKPVTANISIRRERLDGTLIDEQPTYVGQRIEIEAPIDPDVRLFILVEADGYQDWEVGLRINSKAGLSGPIRLTPTNAAKTPTPRPQGL